VAALLLGWAAAITLHITFNNVVNMQAGMLTLALAIAIGLGGVAIVIGFIYWGLAQERRWLRQTLNLQVGVSSGESAVVQKLDNLDELLSPVAMGFCAETREQIKTLINLQARLGLKRKVQEMTPDPKLRAEMEKEVNALRDESDKLRREIGVYCMSYVRSILPPNTEPMWARLGQSLQSQPSEGPSLWSELDDKIQEGEQ
jgi:hypothetical protein